MKNRRELLLRGMRNLIRKDNDKNSEKIRSIRSIVNYFLFLSPRVKTNYRVLINRLTKKLRRNVVYSRFPFSRYVHTNVHVQRPTAEAREFQVNFTPRSRR